ncbi:MAG: hypothetical protein ACR2MD_04185 [Aridibacter sp.]
MSKTKKRLSKKAKEALKVLENSKLMENSKTTKSLDKDASDTPDNSVIKNNVAHRPRPNKKRG